MPSLQQQTTSPSQLLSLFTAGLLLQEEVRSSPTVRSPRGVIERLCRNDWTETALSSSAGHVWLLPSGLKPSSQPTRSDNSRSQLVLSQPEATAGPPHPHADGKESAPLPAPPPCLCALAGASARLADASGTAREHQLLEAFSNLIWPNKVGTINSDLVTERLKVKRRHLLYV